MSSNNISGFTGMPDFGKWTSHFPGQVKANKIGLTNVQKTFDMFMNGMQDDMSKPYKLAGEMTAGIRPFDPTELIMTIVETERKISLAVRVINDTVRGVKQLEQIQA